MTARTRQSALTGVGLVTLYTMVISTADAITKFLAAGYAAPQLFALSGAIVVALTLVTARATSGRQSLHTSCPGAMALRAGLTVVGSIAFFSAFRRLPLVEVFVFIGIIPIFSGLLSFPILGERVRATSWAALAAGFAGVICLFPAGLHSVSLGHVAGFVASLSGALSLVLARFICRRERNTLAQVLYPNAALCLVMCVALPFVYHPMPVSDLVWVIAYAFCLFAARWLVVLALRHLAAYAVTPLMNLQFVWMVLIGALIFGETPATNLFLGVSIIMGSGLVLVWDQLQPNKLMIRPFGSQSRWAHQQEDNVKIAR